MKSGLKILLFLFINLFHIQLLVGQESEIKGKVTDDAGKPIKFATISYHGQSIGTYSDTLGVFGLKKVACDTLLISHIGYKSRLVSIEKTGPDKDVNIVLEAKTEDLSEIVVQGKKHTNRFKEKVSYENGTKCDNRISPMYYGMMNAIYFSNIKTPCRIEKVSMFVKESCPTNNQIRIRFLTVDSITQKPGVDFVNENIVISKIKKNSWLHVQLKDYNIILPTTDFFIVLESLSNGNDCFNNSANRESKGSYNLSIATVETKAIGYRKFFDREWKNQSEEIGDKSLAKKNEVQHFQEVKESVLKGLTDKEEIERFSSYFDEQLANSLDRIDDKWNFVPYIKIDTKAIANTQ